MIKGFDFYKTTPAYFAGYESGLTDPNTVTPPEKWKGQDARLWKRGREDGIQAMIDEALGPDQDDFDTEEF